MLREPAGTLSGLVELTRRTAAYALVAIATTRALRAGGRRVRLPDAALEASLSIGLVFFLLRPGRFRLAEHLAFLSLGAFAGLWASWALGRGRPAWLARAAAGEPRWLVALGLPALLTLPPVVKPLHSLWDVSGFYDSLAYDQFAYRIATGEATAGDSFVMPFYQYGLAFFYFIFGHLFSVQQVVSGLLAVTSVVLVGLSAWNLYRSRTAALIAGLVTAFLDELRTFLTITQVENWYIPLICLTLYAFTAYWRCPSRSHALLLGLAVGLAFNTRAQGLFYFGAVCAAPLLRPGTRCRERAAHSLMAFGVVSLSLAPWSLRNYIVEGRFSPASDQATVALLFNHPRAGFYGLRSDLGRWWDVLAEYERIYPDKQTRYRLIKAEFYQNLRADPLRQLRAFCWRSLSFYGLLPPGFWHPGGPRPTDWPSEWQGYVRSRYNSLFFILASLVALLRHPGRLTALLMAFVVGNLGVLMLASQTESRISYPVLPIHLLLALALVFPLRACDEPGSWSLAERLRAEPWRRLLPIGAIAAAVFLAGAYWTMGRKDLRAPLRERAVVYDRNLTIDGRLRSLNRRYGWREDSGRPRPTYEAHERVRLRARVSNYQLPPKGDSDRPGFPLFSSHPLRETYYFAHPPEGSSVAVSYFGASLDQPLREGDLIDIEGELLYASDPDVPGREYAAYWLKASKVLRVLASDGR